jgi:hypothetical protein
MASMAERSGADQACSQGFRKENTISRFGIVVLLNVLHIDHTRNGITKLDGVVEEAIAVRGPNPVDLISPLNRRILQSLSG